MDTLMIWWRNAILFVCAIMAILAISPKDSPIWPAVEAVGLGSRCPKIQDANGNGIPAIPWTMHLHGADCWPDHPDYVQPEGGWPPDPHFRQYPTEIKVP